MKWVLLTPVSGRPQLPKWPTSEAISEYIQQINFMTPFVVQWIKGVDAARFSSEEKRKLETEILRKHLTPDDFVIALDENGKNVNTMDFKKLTEDAMMSGKKRVVCVVGGPYGYDPKVIGAQKTIQLSNLVMNQPVAITVLLEQIFRVFTIIKGIPYHNE